MLTTLVSCYYGYVITNDNQKLVGQIRLPDMVPELDRLSELRDKRNIVVIDKDSLYRFNAKEIKYVTINKQVAVIPIIKSALVTK
jgi:deoxycytidine triphosphate deaminase